MKRISLSLKKGIFDTYSSIVYPGQLDKFYPSITFKIVSEVGKNPCEKKKILFNSLTFTVGEVRFSNTSCVDSSRVHFTMDRQDFEEIEPGTFRCKVYSLGKLFIQGNPVLIEVNRPRLEITVDKCQAKDSIYCAHQSCFKLSQLDILVPEKVDELPDETVDISDQVEKIVHSCITDIVKKENKE